MPTKNPRINVVLEKGLYSAVSDLAQQEGISKSMAVRDLVKEAMEIRGDMALTALAEEREQTFNPDTALSHEEVWA
ncbi:MAG: toxin-antitoxin system, antitoxin component [Desulfonatronovibrio sp.]